MAAYKSECSPPPPIDSITLPLHSTSPRLKLSWPKASLQFTCTGLYQRVR